MRTIVVGLLADPGSPTSIVRGLLTDLPGAFADHISDQVVWKVRLLTHALPLDESGNVEVWAHSDALMKANNWDVMVCVTELTRRLGNRFFVSEANERVSVALISLPALGPVRVRHHVRKELLRLVLTLTREVFEDGSARELWWQRRPCKNSGRRSEDEPNDLEKGTHSDQPLTGLGGAMRLIGGMVSVNQPWRLVPSLDRAIAAAMATAAFGIFYSSIWAMAESLSAFRLALITTLVTTAMVGWLIFHNNLWQRDQDLPEEGGVGLYNIATIVTITFGVLSTYVVLLTLTLIAAVVVIPASYMATVLGQDVGTGEYLQLAWFVSSMGTFAGALGSSFESDDAILRATYGRRELERHRQSRRDENG